MPETIDPEAMHIDELPGVWAPAQWEMTAAESAQEAESQASASLLATIDVPEAILRLLLNELEIVRLYGPPAGYDAQEQGEWDSQLITYGFKRSVTLAGITRDAESLELVYTLEGLGSWSMSIFPERVTIELI